jgi:hypothetical protein
MRLTLAKCGRFLARFVGAQKGFHVGDKLSPFGPVRKWFSTEPSEEDKKGGKTNGGSAP